jgi:hypothetical protein
MTNEEIFQKAMAQARKNGYKGTGWGAKNLPIDTITFILFSHDFAKSFFPKTDEHGFHKDDAWKYYLQQMILEDNPLHYLKKFL